VADAAAFWLSVVACILLARKHREEKWNWFFYSAAAYLVLNAAVCATLVGVYDRYQSRVAWLIPLCLMTDLCNRHARAANPERVGETAPR
jgi:bacteriorhodopsin